MISDFSRRYFLKVLAAGAATSAGALAGCSSGAANGQSETFGDINAGNVSALSVDQIKAVPGAPAFVGRDSNGIYAMTTTCTHQGCDLATGTITATFIQCGCHLSEFDYDGNVIMGPATQPLAHFKVDVAADGTITIHGATKVDASTRVPVTT